ncbi:MAG: hypothetical protein DRI54_03455 [Bacteroidetes bacterium]|nr:MAG: hypothetical protein DRI54_03455 [Bacteroidota bacterium]
MKKMNKFLEYFWLVISVVSVILVTYVYTAIGTKDNMILILLPVIAIAMYVYRRKVSKVLDRND